MAVETIIQPLIDPIFLVLSIIFIVFLITKRKGFDQAYEQVIKQRDFTNKMVIDFVVKTLFWLIRLAIFVCAFMTELFTVNPFALKDIHEKQLIQITKPLGKPYKISRKYGSANYSRYKYHNVNADMLSLTQKTIELQGDWIKVAKKDMDYPNETFAQYCLDLYHQKIKNYEQSTLIEIKICFFCD